MSLQDKRGLIHDGTRSRASRPGFIALLVLGIPSLALSAPPAAGAKLVAEGVQVTTRSAVSSPATKDVEVAQSSARLPRDDVSALMAQFAERVPRLKALRGSILNPGSVLPNPAIEQSARRMEERSEEGYSHAQFSLAEMYLTGEGLPKDHQKATELLTRAAMSGYLPAQLTLGMLAAEGLGMERNLAEAHTWLAVAAEQGQKAAAEVLPMLEKHMSTRDTVEARRRSFQLNRVLVIIHGGDLSKASKTELSERLRIAAALGDVESVYVLLAQGADADDADLDGRTALIEAAWRGYSRIVKALIDNGANLSSFDNTRKNALMWAAINGHAEVLLGLLAAGSPIDEQDNEGITALMRAAWNSHTAAVKILVNAGARIDIQDKKGLTALQYGDRAGNVEIQRLLRTAASRG